MRARSRRSASDYFSAALLELSIMGIFVLIAQPQLRQGLLELVQPSSVAKSSTGSPVAEPALETFPALSQTAARYSQAAVADVAPRLDPLPATLSALAGQNGTPAATNNWPMRTASYAPLEQFEAFSVSVSDADRPSAAADSVRTSGQRVASYAPNAAATQLTANDWNIAGAAQSPRPLSGWTSSRPADAAYRDSYPPPFGTQSQWK